MKQFENTIVATNGKKGALQGKPLNVAEQNPGLPAIVEFRCETLPERAIPFNGLLTNRVLSALPGPDFARLLPHLEPVSLLAGQDICGFGDFISLAYFPETAVITHLYLLSDGSTTSAAVIGNDGMIGLGAILESTPQSYATQVTIAGSALRIEIEALKEEFARGEALQQVLLSYTSCRLAQLSQKAVCNGRHKLEDRLCTWLLMVHDRANQDSLRLTHEQIAHHLGARRAGITDACNSLRKAGIIHYRRGVIRISNRELLEAAACECHPVFRQISQHIIAPQLIRNVEKGRIAS